MKQITIVLSVMATAASPATAFPVIQWAIGDGGNGHFYELVETPTTWDQANINAFTSDFAGQPGSLATMTSQEENAFVATNLLNSVNFYDAWIGGYQPGGSPEPDGNWQWVTGEPWDFQNWDNAEPSNTFGNENAVWMFTGLNAPIYFGKWNDAPSVFERPYIVEYVPEPATGLLVFGSLLVFLRRTKN